jgi:lipoate-protein ligase A
VALPAFDTVHLHREPLADGIAREADWLAGCVDSGPAAHLWCAPPGFVVPRKLTRLSEWQSALAAQPAGSVQIRSSGGGLVPQGPGVWNLSLAFADPALQPRDAESIYLELCERLARALATLGIRAAPQAVPGSFCDGRFNLASGGRKLVGTAQAWRRIAGRQAVLAHAVIVVDADPVELTARANAFEATLGQPPPYRADALTSVAEAAGDTHIAPRALAAMIDSLTRRAAAPD